ncbi:MAG: WcaF family extracellular polysaccharide biosynthesis acetyltransferase [Planctomycetota bacterium]|nr:WcaF family extracellular polysaccharide biosynthesis acetyltransferase [Planctomycetota bacterium]
MTTSPAPTSGQQPAKPTDREGTTYTFGQNVLRALWMILGRTAFRLSFHNWYAWRRFILRLFGAKVGPRTHIRNTCRIDIPWNLEIGEECLIGDYSVLYSLGKVRIGDRTVISQYAHLCGGSHDHTKRRFDLIRAPVTVGNDCWIAAEAFVGPGVNVGDLCVLGARSSAFKDMEPGMIYVGSPARKLGPRVITG